MDADPGLETIRLLIHGASKDGRMPPGARAGMLRFMGAAGEKVRAVRIDVSATYTNQFVDEVSQ